MRWMTGLGALLVIAGAGHAQAQSCEEAWYQRNTIYKQGGYCFRTQKAISAFGNAGCSYDEVQDVPLSARQRAAVAEIRGFERRQGCTP